jgi:hypothetical protein
MTDRNKSSIKRESSAAFLRRLRNSRPGISKDEAEVERVTSRAKNVRDVAPLMKELADDGFVFDSLRHFRHSGIKYTQAIPILLKWLRQTDNYDVKEEIVRTLSVPWATGRAAPVLAAEYRNSPASQGSYKWAIGNALSIVADDSVADDVIALATDRRHGKAREMLAVALGNMKDPRVLDVLVGLLQDQEMAGHAIIGLGNLKASRARASIEPFLDDKKAWIRNETRKALAKIDRHAEKTREKLQIRRVQ